MLMVGLQVAVVFPLTFAAEITCCVVEFSVTLGTNVNVAGPVVCVSALTM